MCLKVNSAPSACFTRHGKCQKSLWFTGCQEWFYQEIKQSSVAAALSLIDLRRNVEDFNLRELSRHPPSPVWQFCLRVLRTTRWPLCARTGADVAGRHPGSAAAGHSSHFMAFHRHRVIWLNLQSWSGIEELNVCCEKKKKGSWSDSNRSVHVAWFHLPSSYSTHTHLSSMQEN